MTTKKWIFHLIFSVTFFHHGRAKKNTLTQFFFYLKISIYCYLFIFFFRQGLVTGLQEVDKLKSQVQDVHVPLEVFE